VKEFQREEEVCRVAVLMTQYGFRGYQRSGRFNRPQNKLDDVEVGVVKRLE
jgi:hypothetical protein